MTFVQPAALPRTGLSHGSSAVCARPAAAPVVIAAPLDIRAAKHVQFKAAKKADRYRPKKHRPSDINRKPPPFNPEPLRAEGLPPVMTVIPQAVAAASESEVIPEAAANVTESEAIPDTAATAAESE